MADADARAVMGSAAGAGGVRERTAVGIEPRPVAEMSRASSTASPTPAAAQARPLM